MEIFRVVQAFNNDERKKKMPDENHCISQILSLYPSTSYTLKKDSLIFLQLHNKMSNECSGVPEK